MAGRTLTLSPRVISSLLTRLLVYIYTQIHTRASCTRAATTAEEKNNVCTRGRERIPKANWNCFLIKYLIKSFPPPTPPSPPPAQDEHSAVRYRRPSTFPRNTGARGTAVIVNLRTAPFGLPVDRIGRSSCSRVFGRISRKIAAPGWRTKNGRS